MSDLTRSKHPLALDVARKGAPLEATATAK
jgi:hypothetical protein